MNESSQKQNDSASAAAPGPSGAVKVGSPTGAGGEWGGLAQAEAQHRLREQGYNELSEKKRNLFLEFFCISGGQFRGSSKRRQFSPPVYSTGPEHPPSFDFGAAGSSAFPAADAIRADRTQYRGARLPYAKFPRNAAL